MVWASSYCLDCTPFIPTRLQRWSQEHTHTKKKKNEAEAKAKDRPSEDRPSNARGQSQERRTQRICVLKKKGLLTKK